MMLSYMICVNTLPIAPGLVFVGLDFHASCALPVRDWVIVQSVFNLLNLAWTARLGVFLIGKAESEDRVEFFAGCADPVDLTRC